MQPGVDPHHAGVICSAKRGLARRRRSTPNRPDRIRCRWRWRALFFGFEGCTVTTGPKISSVAQRLLGDRPAMTAGVRWNPVPGPRSPSGPRRLPRRRGRGILDLVAVRGITGPIGKSLTASTKRVRKSSYSDACTSTREPHGSCPEFRKPARTTPGSPRRCHQDDGGVLAAQLEAEFLEHQAAVAATMRPVAVPPVKK